jgi:hypothetical protein
MVHFPINYKFITHLRKQLIQLRHHKNIRILNLPNLRSRQCINPTSPRQTQNTLLHSLVALVAKRKKFLENHLINLISIPFPRVLADDSRICDICGEYKTSNFRPVISDWIGKQRLLPDELRVMSCNPCYCRSQTLTFLPNHSSFTAADSDV